MKMFCYQCQEAAGNVGCKVKGVCGKEATTAILQDSLMHVLKGISVYAEKAIEKGELSQADRSFVLYNIFTTITNANFDDERFVTQIKDALKLRDNLKSKYGSDVNVSHDSLTWTGSTKEEFLKKGSEAGVLSTANEDVRSLRELLIYGAKGACAYTEHAGNLDYFDDSVTDGLIKAIATTTKDLTTDEMIGEVLKVGELCVNAMALLDKANTTSYGNPEITKVNIGVGKNPGILISGHDLKDMEELLKQTDGTGIDIYTHSEMLPAHYYPKFKKYSHFVGNYGGSWWAQGSEFDSFNGPILMTTNCITPVKSGYKDRMYTTGAAGYPEIKHIGERAKGGVKDFSEIIEQAKKCSSPTEIETGEIVGGFAHNQVLALADKVVDAVKSGAIKRFVVMGGCDGRNNDRQYFTDVAKNLPDDSIILTAGCAKFRYNKLDLGNIGGIPRVLDAGQCNDSYSLAVIALKLKEVFGLDDINKLPISFDIAWYEQKAVTVFLALLYLGVKGIRLGPTLPAFLSPNVAKVIVDNFDVKPTGDVQKDIDDMMAGN